MREPTVRRVAHLIVLDATASVLLLRRPPRGLSSPHGYWTTPGGKVDERETFIEAARRGLMEQMGLEASVSRELWQEQFRWASPEGWVDRVEKYFLGQLSGMPVEDLRTGPDVESRWWTLHELRATVEEIRPKAFPGHLVRTMELCEVVSASGEKTGRVAPPGLPLEPGEFYPVVHVWIKDERGRYLIQLRANDVDADPGVWTTTSGRVLAGEGRMSAAVRTVREQLGIQPSPRHLEHLCPSQAADRRADVWIISASPSQVGRIRTSPIVFDWMWVSREQLDAMIGEGELFPYGYLPALPT